MKNKISRRQFIKSTAKTGAVIGLTGEFMGRSIFAPPNQFDLIIKNGQIIDGENDKAIEADLGIVNDHIERIGHLNESKSKMVIDVQGKAVSPGFFDIHCHTDTELLVSPKGESQIRQGVTTVLGGNCAGSPFPRKRDLSPSEERSQKQIELKFDWTNLEGYHSKMEKRGIGINHATLVGQGTIRGYVMGDENRVPTAQEMEAQKKLVAEAMEQGAFGLSTGLEYIPSRFASTSELIELCETVSKYGGFYATHMRNEGPELMEAVTEAIHIAESAQLPLQISHLKSTGRKNYYKVHYVFDLMEKTRERGLDVTADRYPYIASSTTLNIKFPQWAVAGGTEKFVERLKDPKLRQEMKQETLDRLKSEYGWESMLIHSVRNEKNRHLIGKYIQEAADEKNQDPYEFACDLLISEGGSLSIFGFAMGEENLEFVLTHPLVMLCSDGSAQAPSGPLDRGHPHPRNYGTFPRFLRVFVREKNLLSLPEAIKKMTSMPAYKMGLKKRGVLKKGNYADIVVFDAAKISDKATFLEPKQYPEGIDYVIVNGKIVVDHGKHTGNLSGKVLHGPGK